MKKLIIQIPCLNEAATLPATLAQLPRQLAGYDAVEILVIDDGSTDNTAEIARQHGEHHVLRLPLNRGLARAFTAGLHRALELGAHTVLNLDADNQYRAADIPALLAPILSGQAQVTLGERPLSEITNFSRLKKTLHGIGNLALRQFAGFSVTDATSGFRAIHHETARRIFIYTGYTYTTEMLFRLAYLGVPVLGVPVGVNAQVLRPSRLIRSNASYLYKTAAAIIICCVLYHPMKFFSFLSLLAGVAGLAALALPGGLAPVFSTALLGSSAVALLLGFACSATHANRMLLEELHLKQPQP